MVVQGPPTRIFFFCSRSKQPTWYPPEWTSNSAGFPLAGTQHPLPLMAPSEEGWLSNPILLSMPGKRQGQADANAE